MFKIVCTDHNFEDMEFERQIIEQNGCSFEEHKCFDEDSLAEAVRDADAVMNQYGPVTAKAIQSMTRARGIARYGIGVDTIDVEAATSAGIWVANVPDYCIDEVATHAAALLLGIARKVPEGDRQIRSGIWDNNALRFMHPVTGKTLGFLGFGRIAQAVAERIQGFNMNLIAYDPYVKEGDVAAQGVRLLTTIEELLAESDFVTIHMPLTDETHHLISVERLKLMKPTAYIINTARGPIIDTLALAEALRDGQLAGAALDTVEEEPIPSDHPLLELDNVILTPHIAWYSERSRQEIRRRVAEEAIRMAKGEPPECPVNKIG